MRPYFIFTTFLIYLFTFLPTKAQEKKEPKDKKLDSLLKVLEEKKANTEKVRVMALITAHYSRKDIKKALEYAKKTHELAQKTQDKKSLGLSNRALGIVYDGQGEVDKTFLHLKEAVRIFEELKEDELLHEAYNEIAKAYYNQSVSEKALSYFFKTLTYAQRAGKKDLEAKLLNNIASLYAREEDIENAEKYFLLSSKINREIKNYGQIASNLNNLAILYKNKQQYKEAIAAIEEMMTLEAQIKEPIKIATGFGTLASVYRSQKDFEKAFQYAKKALDMKIKANDKRGTLTATNEIGNIYLDQKDYLNAEKYMKDALAQGLKIKAYTLLIGVYQDLATISAKQGKYKDAYDYEFLFIKIKDSLQSTERSNQIIKMKTIYDTEAKDAENKRLKLIGESQATRSFWIITTVALALLGVLIVVFILYRNNEHKRKLNKILTIQKAELNEQKEEIQVQNEELKQQQEEIIAQRDYISSQNDELIAQNGLIENKNHIIESSIQVALEIQNAMLPYPVRMREALPDYFVVNMPRDIVSGDYYWLQKQEDSTILAVIDCVGHGVPGALMSMIAHALLDKVVILQEIREPAQILKHLNDEVKYALQANTDTSQGGMDIALVKWHKTPSEKINLTFGGAKRPLFIKRPQTQEIEEISGTRRSVGGEINISLPFEQHSLELEENTMIYMFSDGITDQNDEKRSRLGNTKLKHVLAANAHFDLNLQKNAIEKMLQVHMANTIQRDDILLIGIRF